jgi:septum formation inhibitor-activating ATPase MinD
VEKAIRKAVYRRIPNQYGEVIKSVNLGKPLLLESRSEFLRAINEWAETLAGRALAPQPPKKKEGKGMFGFLGR